MYNVSINKTTFKPVLLWDRIKGLILWHINAYCGAAVHKPQYTRYKAAAVDELQYMRDKRVSRVMGRLVY